jgi:hypothetical protein
MAEAYSLADSTTSAGQRNAMDASWALLRWCIIPDQARIASPALIQIKMASRLRGHGGLMERRQAPADLVAATIALRDKDSRCLWERAIR